MNTALPTTATTHLVPEHHLTAQGLVEAYRKTEEHPVHTRIFWRNAVASGDTALGYWDWVKLWLTHAFEEATGANATVVLRQKARQLRGAGYALVMFSPEELINVCASELEDHLTQRGNEFLAARQGK